MKNYKSSTKNFFNYILEGIGSIVDGFGYMVGVYVYDDEILDIIRDKRPGWEKDAEALQKDWEAVGNDMKKIGL